MLPDYSGGSLVNLMQSISVGLSGIADETLGVLGLLDPAEVRAARGVLLVMIDGLGYHTYRRHGSWLTAHLRGSITSVFPSATSSAITTVHTGRSPAGHAVVGWNMHLPEAGGVTTLLPFRPRDSKVGLSGRGFSVQSFVGAPPMTRTWAFDSVHVLPKQLASSAYSTAMAGTARRIPAGTLGQWTQRTIDAVRGDPAPRYVYAYWAELDSRSHRSGTNSAAARRHLREIERAVGRMITALAGTGTLIVVTADHGFIDVGELHRVEDHPELCRALSLPLSGEGRVAYCHVKPGFGETFAAYVRENLGHAFELHPAARLVEAGWFGPEAPDPRLSDRVGDWVLVGRDRHVIKDTLPGEPPWKNIGVHGGVSEDEMLVPLFVVRC
jgi:hypothetical protein